MKVEVEFITARLNGKLLFCEAISDCYSEVQVIVSKSDLDDVSLEALRRISWFSEYDNAFNIGCCEAKDACGDYGNLKIWIESKTVDFE